MREQDSVLQDVDFRARRYNPSTALFETPDSIIQQPLDPQQLNRYSFERNSPLNHKDPTGHVAILDDIAEGYLVYGAFIALTYAEEWVAANGIPFVARQIGLHSEIAQKIANWPENWPAKKTDTQGTITYNQDTSQSCQLNYCPDTRSRPGTTATTPQQANAISQDAQSRDTRSTSSPVSTSTSGIRIGSKVTTRSGRTGTYMGGGLTVYDSPASKTQSKK